jgi:hypothetical protein
LLLTFSKRNIYVSNFTTEERTTQKKWIRKTTQKNKRRKRKRNNNWKTISSLQIENKKEGETVLLEKEGVAGETFGFPAIISNSNI